MTKKKILVLGITMNGAGTEKSFLSFINQIDFTQYDVDLLLAEKSGLFLPLLPPEVRVLTMESCGEMFTMTSENATSVLMDCFVRKNPLSLFRIAPYFLKMRLNPKKKKDYAMRLWVSMMRLMPRQKLGTYDAALAYWGDKTMFYMIDKIDARKKIAWLHFDYVNPPRDDVLYGKYFAACDKVITVSETINRHVQEKLPALRDKFLLIENISDPELIRRMADQGARYDDDFDGIRVLTVGRFCEQKATELIPAMTAELVRRGLNLRWYLLGSGTEAYTASILDSAVQLGVQDRIILLEPTTNPYGYIGNCDIYVQPSRHEGKPITVDEAKILCRPIVVSAYRSAQEQLDHGRYGVVCTEDPMSVCDGIYALATDPERCTTLMKTLRQSDFGNREQIEKFIALLD